jgi:hypothetical protein
MVLDPTDDPCELRFSDWREIAGRQMPHALELRRGDDSLGRIEWTSMELTAGKAEEKQP